MSVKSTIASVALIGSTLATIFFFRKPIAEYITKTTGAIGKEIKCTVDFMGVFEECKKTTKTSEQDQKQAIDEYLQKGRRQGINCQQVDNGFECVDALGKFKISKTEKGAPTINGQTLSEYAANVIYNLPSSRSTDWTAKAKADYQALLLQVTRTQDLQKLVKDANGLYKITWKNGTTSFQPLSQAAVDYYRQKGISVVRI